MKGLSIILLVHALGFVTSQTDSWDGDYSCPNCCPKKSLDGNTYTLVDYIYPPPEGCQSGCIYQEYTTKAKYCFGPGGSESECLAAEYAGPFDTCPGKTENTGCSDIFDKLVDFGRLKAAYGCGEDYTDSTITATCLASQCYALFNDTARCGSNNLVDCYTDYATYTACGYGVYGVVVGDNRNNKKCVCQILDEETRDLVASAKGTCDTTDPSVTAMLCIPSMLSAITTCTYPGAGNLADCLNEKMMTYVSIPVCYLHTCNYLQNLFGIYLPNCNYNCPGGCQKITFRNQEWIIFENQDVGLPQDLAISRGKLAARDLVVTPIPTQVLVPGADFTDFPDPQDCTRYLRCFESATCYNSTDGGICPPGELFKPDSANPELNGCYPADGVDCNDVPITTSTYGVVPICCPDNEDFSDVGEYSNLKLSAIRSSLDADGFVSGLQMVYGQGAAAIIGTAHGIVDDTSPTFEQRDIGDDEYITKITGYTINGLTCDQQAATFNFTIQTNNPGTRVDPYTRGRDPVPADDAVYWTMSHSEPAGEVNGGCPLVYICGSKNKDVIQVLTAHWAECRHSTNVYTPFETVA